MFVLAIAGMLALSSARALDKDGAPPAEGGRNRPAPEANQKKPDADPKKAAGVPANPQDKKVAKVFVTYDANKDGSVSDEEIVAMMEGKQNSRGKREIRKAVDRADKDNDDVLNFDEFQWWYQIGRLDEDARNR